MRETSKSMENKGVVPDQLGRRGLLLEKEDISSET
jgi:hypothetical protein